MNNTKNALERKVLEQKRTRNIIAGVLFIGLSSASNLLMPDIILNYYQHKKEYLESNPTEINYYRKTAERHAITHAGTLGSLWGLVNMGAFAAGAGLMYSKSPYKRRKSKE